MCLLALRSSVALTLHLLIILNSGKFRWYVAGSALELAYLYFSFHWLFRGINLDQKLSFFSYLIVDLLHVIGFNYVALICR